MRALLPLLLGFGGLCALEGAVIEKPRPRIERDSSESCKENSLATLSPFLVVQKGQPNSYGIEFNHWNVRSSACRCPLSMLGYGASIGYGGGQAILSPYLQATGPQSFEWIGIAAGPQLRLRDEMELGFGGHAWAAFVGTDISYSPDRGAAYGLYIFLPIFPALLMAFTQ